MFELITKSKFSLIISILGLLGVALDCFDNHTIKTDALFMSVGFLFILFAYWEQRNGSKNVFVLIGLIGYIVSFVAFIYRYFL